MTPIGKTDKSAWIESEGFRRSRSLDTGFPSTEENASDSVPVKDDDDSDDDVLCLAPERATSPPVPIPLTPGKERTSRKDRPSLSRSKGNLSGGGGLENRRKSRRSTATDDDDWPTFVDRCVTKVKTLINK